MGDARRNEEFRRRIAARIDELAAQDDLNADSRDTVVLDQQSVGRLSRLDALQQQAMAKATLRKRAAELKALRAALARIDAEDYGYCEDCGDEIPPKRLELNLTATRCVSCLGG